MSVSDNSLLVSKQEAGIFADELDNYQRETNEPTLGSPDTSATLEIEEARRRPRRIVYYYDNNDIEEHVFARHAPAGPAPCCCGTHAVTVGETAAVEKPRIGSPGPIGLFAFGMTTLLFNVHNAQISKLNTATMGIVIFYGGLTQFLCGFFELINKNTFGCTVSTTYGAFWIATAALYLYPTDENVVMGGSTFTGGFWLLWFFFAGTLFASSFRQPFMCILLFFSVALNFLLNSIGYFSHSQAVTTAAGFEGIVVGSLATYLGMAFTMRDAYGRSILPILFQKNFSYTEW